MPGSAGARRLVRGSQNSNHRPTECVSGTLLNANLQLQKSINDKIGKELDPRQRGGDRGP